MPDSRRKIIGGLLALGGVSAAEAGGVRDRGYSEDFRNCSTFELDRSEAASQSLAEGIVWLSRGAIPDPGDAQVQFLAGAIRRTIHALVGCDG